MQVSYYNKLIQKKIHVKPQDVLKYANLLIYISTWTTFSFG